jgi:hypothetical protein
LERRTFPSGKDKIDHERGRHDDLCNAAAGALTLASRRPQPEPPIVLPYFYGKNCGEMGFGVDSMPAPAPAPCCGTATAGSTAGSTASCSGAR